MNRRGYLSLFAGGISCGAVKAFRDRNRDRGFFNQGYQYGRFATENGDNIDLDIELKYYGNGTGLTPKISTEAIVPKSLYKKENKKNKEMHEIILQVQDSDFVDNVIKQIKNNSIQNGDYTVDEIKGQIFKDYYPSFVKSVGQDAITFYYDIDTTGHLTYAKHPIESLVDGSGDCVDATILMYSLLSNRGYDAGYFVLPGHVGLIISLEELANSDWPVCYTKKGTDYTYIEPNNPNYIGEVNRNSDYNLNDGILAWTQKHGFDVLNPSALSKFDLNIIPEEHQDLV